MEILCLLRQAPTQLAHQTHRAGRDAQRSTEPFNLTAKEFSGGLLKVQPLTDMKLPRFPAGSRDNVCLGGPCGGSPEPTGAGSKPWIDTAGIVGEVRLCDRNIGLQPLDELPKTRRCWPV